MAKVRMFTPTYHRFEATKRCLLSVTASMASQFLKLSVAAGTA